MNKTLLWLSLGLLVLGTAVSAENHTVGEGADENGLTDDEDDVADYMPLVWLVVIAGIVFLVAKYGP